MALTINTNISSMIVQSNLSKATSTLNDAIEKMTTGYKINHAGDNAAGYSIARKWETHLGSLSVASDNAATGADMLTTLEDTYSLISSHLQRVRDLTEQAANGTYGSDSLKALNAEITARLAEVDRIAGNCEFNGLRLMNGSMGNISLQVGLYSDDNSKIVLSASLFEKSNVTSLFKVTELSKIAQSCTGYNPEASGSLHITSDKPSEMLTTIDSVISEISSRVTTLGAAQNRIDSAIEALEVQTENLTSSLSTLRDTDVASESSNYIQAQILQQASASLLSTANQLPSLALNLL